MAKKWEYKFRSLNGGTEVWVDGYNVRRIEMVGTQQDELNELGKNGWELVHYHFSEISAKCYLIFKRELKKIKKIKERRKKK